MEKIRWLGFPFKRRLIFHQGSPGALIARIIVLRTGRLLQVPAILLFSFLTISGSWGDDSFTPTIGLGVKEKTGALLSFPFPADKPAHRWHTFFGASRDFGEAVAVDLHGDVILTGSSSAPWLGPDGKQPLQAHNGWWDFSILKLSPDGAYRWHTFLGSSEYDDGHGIAVDQEGNIYVTGRSKALWNGPGNKPPLHGHSGDLDIVVIKLDPAGAFQWHTFYGSPGYDEGLKIKLDTQGNVYVTGSSNGPWEGPGPGDIPKQAHHGGADLFVLKLGPDGSYLWHTFFGSDQDDYGVSLETVSPGQVYIAGASYGTWNGPQGEKPLTGYQGAMDGFVLKLNDIGDYSWHTFFGSADRDNAINLTTDTAGNPLVVGFGSSSWKGPNGEPPLRPHNGGLDILVLRLDVNGAYRWHTFFGSAADDAAYALALDHTNHIYLTGYSAAGWNGPTSDDLPRNPHSGYGDGFVLSLNPEGSYAWHTFFGAKRLSEESFRGFDRGMGMVLDNRVPNNRSLFLTGSSDAPWEGPWGEQPVRAYTGISDQLLVLALRLLPTRLYLPLVFHN